MDILGSIEGVLYIKVYACVLKDNFQQCKKLTDYTGILIFYFPYFPTITSVITIFILHYMSASKL